MKKFYPLLAFVLFATALFSSNAEGFIVTLDGIHLTGKIGKIFYTNYNNEVIYTNDFGNEYRIDARRISGFAIMEGSALVRYKTQYQEGLWYFLKVVHLDEELNLYRNPDRNDVIIRNSLFNSEQHFLPNGYWLEFKGQAPFSVYRMGFKKLMKEKLAQYPELAKKIGKRGFRYSNIEHIVKTYNNWYRDQKLMM